MDTQVASTYTVFDGDTRVVRADLAAMLRAVKQRLNADVQASLLIFEDRTGRQVDFDFRGSVDEVVQRARPAPDANKPGPGRPKLGVLSREISLLPRHWAWLEGQPQGMSAAIRRLVEEAAKKEPARAEARRAMEATGNVMTALAGNREGFEEAMRALYAGDRERFTALIQPWPKDVREHLAGLATGELLQA